MKKVLSIVLALAMVLCMIPALSAANKMSYSDHKYALTVYQWNNVKKAVNAEKAECPDSFVALSTASTANSITADFWYDENDAVKTGKWSDGRCMALVEVAGFMFAKSDVTADDKNIPVKGNVAFTIDGKTMTISDNAPYKKCCGVSLEGKSITFPLELIEGGYTKEDIKIVATWKDSSDNEYTETAIVSVKLVDKAEPAKVEKKAVITDIQQNTGSKIDATNDNVAYKDVAVSTYIVGSKIYADFADDYSSDFTMDITFADENGAPFTGITYVNETGKAIELFNGKKFDTDDYKVRKLNKSVGTFVFLHDGDANSKSGIQFVLETENGIYKTDKKYDVVIRTGIRPADPKGIYLDKSEVTIKVGEEYIPAIKASNDGRALVPTDVAIKGNTNVIDRVAGNKIVGTKPGVAYIMAGYGSSYNTLVSKYSWSDWFWYHDSKVTEPEKVDDFAYVSSMQKVTVIPADAVIPSQTTDYVVTCRNLNVRKGAGTSFGKTGMVHRGDVLKVVEIKDGWAKLADGTYVCAKYITK